VPAAALSAPPGASTLLVEVVDPRHEAEREAFLDAIWDAGALVHVSLTLDGPGERAAACLVRADAEWLELREGDIVGVRLPRTLLPCQVAAQG
jgi:hypothetical protein